MTQVGAKFGQWLDLVFLQLTLDARPAPEERRSGLNSPPG
jgi:phosphinothricin acetyltransferase